MASIKVTPEVLMAKASEVRNLKGQHDDAIRRITALVRGLNDTWAGEAQRAFVSQYESMQSTFNKFSEILEDYARRMDISAKAFQETDTGLK